MSIEAIQYAFSADVGSAPEKLVLLALCNFADEHGFCYPSGKRIVSMTMLDRKTVLDALAALRDSGKIIDTGKRIGETKQVVVYQVVDVDERNRFHYVYKTTDPESGKFYIGSRSSPIQPDADPYKGSGKWVLTQLEKGVLLVKTVLEMHATRVELLAGEYRQIRGAEDDPLCMNLNTPKRFRKANSPKNGTVPNFPSNSPVFPAKESQKRDTDPSLEPSVEPYPPSEGVNGHTAVDLLGPAPIGRQGQATCPQQIIVDLYHEILGESNPRIAVWDGTRARNLAARWKESPERQVVQWWRDLFVYIRDKCGFITGKVNGRGSRPFTPNLAWMVQRENFIKIIEGAYE